MVLFERLALSSFCEFGHKLIERSKQTAAEAVGTLPEALQPRATHRVPEASISRHPMPDMEQLYNVGLCDKNSHRIPCERLARQAANHENLLPMGMDRVNRSGMSPEIESTAPSIPSCSEKSATRSSKSLEVRSNTSSSPSAYSMSTYWRERTTQITGVNRL